MEIKTVNVTTVYSKQIETSLKTIHIHVKALPEEVMNEIKQKQLSVVGPQTWIYHGSDGKPDTVFRLTVGFPVKDANGNKELKKLENFKCISSMHKGSWDGLRDTYEKIIGEMNQNGKRMTGECREVYHQVDFDNQDNNITEIQIGIK